MATIWCFPIFMTALTCIITIYMYIISMYIALCEKTKRSRLHTQRLEPGNVVELCHSQRAGKELEYANVCGMAALMEGL